ncbi:ribosome maturation factor RimM [Furfurilactobacillus siliginis]|uniref:Ribosome maturation factor RimM n=1 Tax=Furfurilactobacillus siliginis TaxID=348151 RepID=A0A0R2LBB3_9LACO|nr:ribosome maturation factor RimM [Furfurilactobacillus siliginis]KRN96934.1 16S rRNA-processing protein RimM [Furfurilactobacillus siliginis]GEK27693.1 ribosome maturation factor RimM [Furfurilactobacillus siliginis]
MAFYTIGKIVNTQGLKGELRVIADTDFPAERFAKGKTVYVTANQPQAKREQLTITSARNHKSFILITFAGLNDINMVEKYKGSDLFVTEAEQQPLPEGQYYYREIIGLHVIDETGTDIGSIKEVMAPGANDVWVVKRAGKSDLLLPVIDQVVKSVDIEAGQVHIEMMAGLDEDED